MIVGRSDLDLPLLGRLARLAGLGKSLRRLILRRTPLDDSLTRGAVRQAGALILMLLPLLPETCAVITLLPMS